MYSRHVPTKRFNSGVVFSAPGETESVPPDDDTQHYKRRKPNNIRDRTAGARGIGMDEMSVSGTPMPNYHTPIAMFAQYKQYSGNHSLLKAPEEEKATLCLPVLKVSSTTTIKGIVA